MDHPFFRAAAALAMTLALAPAASAANAAPPQQVVADFYAWDIDRPPSTDPALLGPVRHLLSKELAALAAATDVYQAACDPLSPPGDKPWMLDADPWHADVDGALAADGIKVVAVGNTAAKVAVTLSYDPAHWTDTVILVRQDGAWRIADIRFEQGGGLVDSLGHFIRASCGRI